LFIKKFNKKLYQKILNLFLCDPQQMMVLRPGDPVTIKAKTDVRMMLLGGAAMDGPRYIWWNFVASSKERIEKAKQDWKNKKFASVPGDDKEFIPLPENK